MGNDYIISLSNDMSLWFDLKSGDKGIAKLSGTDLEIAISRHSNSRIELKIVAGEKSKKQLGIK